MKLMADLLGRGIAVVALYRTAPELMWKLLERFSRGENSRGVLQFWLPNH